MMRFKRIQFYLKVLVRKFSSFRSNNKISKKYTTVFPQISKQVLTMMTVLSSHSAGDVMMVQPRNLPDVVQEFIALLALLPDQLFLLEQNDPG